MGGGDLPAGAKRLARLILSHFDSATLTITDRDGVEWSVVARDGRVSWRKVINAATIRGAS